jgi:16S rRNA (uracil1498-N3)-methyltransferase
MHRFYLPPEHCHGDIIQLPPNEAHHASRVLRIETGERVAVLDGAGHVIDCEIREVTKRNVILTALKKTYSPPLPCQITLLQAIPKPKAMDYIVQKTTELGAVRIVPLLTDRVIAHVDERSAPDKAAKLQPLAIEAIKQCGSPWLTKIEPPVSLENFLARREQFELPLVASLQSGSRNPHEFIQRFRDTHKRLPKTACLWIGPEGDFTPSEMELILGSGALPISLGSLVLRSDTAAIYGLSVMSYELQSAE